MESCAKCRFWLDSNSAWDGAGQCRRYPPTTTGKHERGGVVSAFVQTTRHDWCGEYKPKPEQQ